MREQNFAQTPLRLVGKNEVLQIAQVFGFLNFSLRSKYPHLAPHDLRGHWLGFPQIGHGWVGFRLASPLSCEAQLREQYMSARRGRHGIALPHLGHAFASTRGVPFGRAKTL